MVNSETFSNLNSVRRRINVQLFEGCADEPGHTFHIQHELGIKKEKMINFRVGFASLGKKNTLEILGERNGWARVLLARTSGRTACAPKAT